ncbi:UNVERIFIED_CONTAM: hypothetical protein GTU68_019219 [Idotea baltica]|nr:hypothetical protein [Idotea baltica]
MPNKLFGRPENSLHILGDLAHGVPPTIWDRHFEAVIHFAAQSHVDTSIDAPTSTVKNNILATQNLLEYTRSIDARFVHISTDEVFGSLKADAPAFTTESQYRPNSPYSASKAACDHLVRSYRETFGLRATTFNCTNNFGPGQDPSKFIPKVIYSLMRKRGIPIYGDGEQIRDWIHVEDFCNFIRTFLTRDVEESSFVVGANDPWTNNQIVTQIIRHYEKLSGYRDLEKLRGITFLCDRLGPLIFGFRSIPAIRLYRISNGNRANRC